MGIKGQILFKDIFQSPYIGAGGQGVIDLWFKTWFLHKPISTKQYGSV